MNAMIQGLHALIYSKDAAGVRAFFKDILKLPHLDAGHGWLIFAMPPAELGVHPDEHENYHELYLMCDDVEATVAELKTKGVEFAREITDAGFGRVTAIKLPGGGELGLYQPAHPTALGLKQRS
jgi:predicted enzyme related to lactoylglutathione lyase